MHGAVKLPQPNPIKQYGSKSELDKDVKSGASVKTGARKERRR
jgi:hypothetical protein